MPVSHAAVGRGQGRGRAECVRPRFKRLQWETKPSVSADRKQSAFWEENGRSSEKPRPSSREVLPISEVAPHGGRPLGEDADSEEPL